MKGRSGKKIKGVKLYRGPARGKRSCRGGCCYWRNRVVGVFQ